jgi:aspartate aminotransferase
MASVLKFGQARLCPPTLEQLGAVAAYRLDESYFDAVRADYQRRRDVMFETLTATRDRAAPRTARSTDRQDRGRGRLDDFAAWLLTDHAVDGETVLVAPAGLLRDGRARPRRIRIAYVLEPAKLERAGRVLLDGLARYRALRPVAARAV